MALKFIRVKEIEEHRLYVLGLDLDYELASLSLAIQQKNSTEKEKSIKRLKEIHAQMEKLKKNR